MNSSIRSHAARWQGVLVLVVLASIPWCVTAAPVLVDPFPELVAPHVPNRLLLLPRPGVSSEQMNRLHESLGMRLRHRHAVRGRTLMEIVESRAPAGLGPSLRRYEASGLVEIAEPDYLVRAAASAFPNDTLFANGLMWNLHNVGGSGGVADADIDAPEAWGINAQASGVVVAVVDSGVRYTHEDLAENMWVNPGEIAGNGRDDDGNGIVDDVHGYNAVEETGDPWDKHGHGTHVSGILGAVGNNGRGIVGVAWRARIMALRFLDDNADGAISDAIQCMDYAIAQGARVLNASWGGPGSSRMLERALDRLRRANILVVAAAGNDGANSDQSPFYPAAYSHANIVSVTATTRGDVLWASSNFGLNTVDLAAPGAEIRSTYFSSDTSYAALNGTSLAAPHVTGAMVLLESMLPGLDLATKKTYLYDSVDLLPALSGKTVTGGRLNLQRMLALVKPLVEPHLQVALESNLGGSSLRLTVTGMANRVYLVEQSTMAGGWQTLETLDLGLDGRGEISVPITGQSPRFFRARLAD